MSRLRLLITATALMTWGALAAAQTLADVAKQEEARRKETRTPGKLYTNEDLRPDPGTAQPAPPAAPPVDATVNEPPSSSTADAQPKDAPKPAAAVVADGQKKDEAYWKKRLTEARSTLDRATTFADALQSRISALTADFTARADPAQRAQIAADRQKAVTELERLRKEIQDDSKAIADLQEEGRKAGAPAGWLR